MTKYPLLKKGLKISEDLKYNEFPETFLKLHTKGYLYPKYFDGLSLVPKFEFLRVKLLDYFCLSLKYLMDAFQFYVDVIQNFMIAFQLSPKCFSKFHEYVLIFAIVFQFVIEVFDGCFSVFRRCDSEFHDCLSAFP